MIYIYSHQYRNKCMHLLHLEMDRGGVGVERRGGGRSFTLLILCTATVQAYTLQHDTIYLCIGLYNLCITVHDCNEPWMATTYSEVSRYFSAEHILQRCPLLKTARTNNMWPTAVQLYTPNSGSEEELEKMATYIHLVDWTFSVATIERKGSRHAPAVTKGKAIVQKVFELQSAGKRSPTQLLRHLFCFLFCLQYVLMTRSEEVTLVETCPLFTHARGCNRRFGPLLCACDYVTPLHC